LRFTSRGSNSPWKFEHVYTGALVNGFRQGHGLNVISDGVSYEGDWKNGKENGRGVFVYGPYFKYEGEWRDGKMSGQGILWNHAKKIKYTPLTSEPENLWVI
jgi:hypothetical protein